MTPYDTNGTGQCCSRGGLLPLNGAERQISQVERCPNGVADSFHFNRDDLLLIVDRFFQNDHKVSITPQRLKPHVLFGHESARAELVPFPVFKPTRERFSTPRLCYHR